MGCDIHCYVEYRKKDPSNDYERDWRSFGGRINPGRNYSIFGRLANVRQGPAVVPVRGIPDDLGFYSRDDWWLFIFDHDTQESGFCSVAQAKEWHDKYHLPYKMGVAGTPAWIQHPDWHSPSWVTPDEWERAIDKKDLKYAAIFSVLRFFESAGQESRVVFWFDN